MLLARLPAPFELDDDSLTVVISPHVFPYRGFIGFSRYALHSLDIIHILQHQHNLTQSLTQL
jgi:hypothetical protein